LKGGIGDHIAQCRVRRIDAPGFDGLWNMIGALLPAFCRTEMPVWGQLIKRRHGFDFVTIQTDMAPSSPEQIEAFYRMPAFLRALNSGVSPMVLRRSFTGRSEMARRDPDDDIPTVVSR
jgi:hypothetical protein